MANLFSDIHKIQGLLISPNPTPNAPGPDLPANALNPIIGLQPKNII